MLNSLIDKLPPGAMQYLSIIVLIILLTVMLAVYRAAIDNNDRMMYGLIAFTSIIAGIIIGGMLFS